MWCTGLVAPRHVGSSRTRDRTRVPCIGRRILNHCATREAPQTPIFSTSPTAPPRALRWAGSAPRTGLLISSLTPAEWESAPETAHIRLQGAHRWIQHCGQHPNFENEIRVRRTASPSAPPPPSLLCASHPFTIVWQAAHQLGPVVTSNNTVYLKLCSAP